MLYSCSTVLCLVNSSFFGTSKRDFFHALRANRKMKIKSNVNKLWLLSLGIVLSISCSVPKTTYKFDYHNYNAGRKAKELKQEVVSDPGPAPVNPETLVANADELGSPIETFKAPVVSPATSSYKDMTKKEQRELRREFKKVIRKITKAKDHVESVEATKGLDKDLKLAAIFGTVGFVGLLLGNLGLVFSVIGAISVLIGVVFFVRWLMRQ